MVLGRWIETVKQMYKQLCRLPCKDATDKKLVYIRYADDFLIGVNGTKSEATADVIFLVSLRYMLSTSRETHGVYHTSFAAGVAEICNTKSIM